MAEVVFGCLRTGQSRQQNGISGQEDGSVGGVDGVRVEGAMRTVGEAVVRAVGVLGLACALLLGGCAGGGGGGGGGAVDDLRGTVASGVPLGGVPVTVVDAGGLSFATTSGADGTFALPGPFTYPVLLRAQAPAGDYYAWALAPGTVQVTPLTTLALMVNTALPDDLAAVFAAWPGGFVAAVTAGLMHAAQAVVNANLETELNAAGLNPAAYDFATAPFPPLHTGIDAVLDSLDLSFDFGAGTYALAMTGGGAIPFDPNIDTASFGIGGSEPVGTYGIFLITLGGVNLNGEDIVATSFRPDAPQVATVSGDATASTYAFTSESIGFVTTAGQVLAQTFTVTVDTADGSTVRRMDYTVGVAGDPGSDIHFGLDCALPASAASCGAFVITPMDAGTGGEHALLTSSSLLTEEGAGGTLNLIGTLRTGNVTGGSGGGTGGGTVGGTDGGTLGSLDLGTTPPPGLNGTFVPGSAITGSLSGAHWFKLTQDVTFTGFNGITQEFLNLSFEDANPSVLLATYQYIVTYLALSGSAPVPSTGVYSVTCSLGCNAASLGVSIDTAARTVTFSDSVLPKDATLGAVSDQVVLNGTLHY
jgi:hypothetical protein